jgi:hypothetical protein
MNVFAMTLLCLVALSRAKEGLFIFGNAMQMKEKSDMWRDVLEELEEQDCVGSGLPVACSRHSDDIRHISEPGMLPAYAPDGLSELLVSIAPVY